MYLDSESDRYFFKLLISNFSLENNTKFDEDLFDVLFEKLIFTDIILMFHIGLTAIYDQKTKISTINLSQLNL